ncbi:aminoglycoside N(3)-acetyltransferase [Nonomuraea diastatica]|uniref:aminoglycoside N(3)-acetyltransferase n=1 Tax=Nonomuraea diastatica TaxID=1848329 RepID=UPI001FE71F85|nr:AAC(3) family N-acetyltransferase [Nonomuraea diastatica]
MVTDLTALGVEYGQVLLVHSSLRSLGHVEGGEGAVVSALRGVLGPDGTLVVPTGTSANSDTSPLHRDAITGMSAGEVAAYRARMPPYDPATTPTNVMGRVPEHVRRLREALRSAHPLTSFAAVGPLAAKIIDGHARDCLLGERSPLARLYDAGASVLLLGVGYDKCTAFHLAEYRYTRCPQRRAYRAVVDDGAGRTWCAFEDVALDDSDFAIVGAAFERTGVVRVGRAGQARARLFSLPDAVDYAARWFAAHRLPQSR